MLGSMLGASDGRDSQWCTEGVENTHTLPMVCDMLG